MPKARAAGADAPADPNKLIRSKAGTYRTADERFEVRQAALGWFLIDSGTTDELGQELTRGPFPTLKAVSEQLPEARRTTIKPLARPRAARRSATTAAPKKRQKVEPPPKTWLDRLPENEAAAARRLIHALSLEGIEDADALVQSARKADAPVVAGRVLEHRLQSLLDDLPTDEREPGRRLLARVAELMTVSGTTLFDPLPGWALVEVEPGTDPPGRRVTVRLRPKRS